MTTKAFNQFFSNKLACKLLVFLLVLCALISIFPSTARAEGSRDLGLAALYPSTATVGSVITYSVTIHNKGTVDVTKVVFSSKFTAGVYPKTWPGCVWYIQQYNQNEVRCNFASIPAGSSRTIRYEFQSPFAQRIDTTMIVDSDKRDSNPANNTLNATTVVQ